MFGGPPVVQDNKAMENQLRDSKRTITTEETVDIDID